ncbi:hypothetical protein PsAD14_04373 [Pseudovibrio sp. Ad14]|nr:hypothetical protein PsW74_04513 [Pseudovibrio sp. W74]KZL06909.1 hypothetical protein PsAD14_04373 [Pseudovibrio sp. Ad14]
MARFNTRQDPLRGITDRFHHDTQLATTTNSKTTPACMNTGHAENRYRLNVSFCICEVLSLAQTPFGSPTGHLSRQVVSPHPTTKAPTLWKALPTTKQRTLLKSPATKNAHSHTPPHRPANTAKSNSCQDPNKGKTDIQRICMLLTFEIHRSGNSSALLPFHPQLSPRGNKEAQLTPKPTKPTLL